MKVRYKGHEIEVKREKCNGGWSMLYYTVYRESDGYECVCDFEDSAEKVTDMIKYMKQRVDEELASDDPWSEKLACGQNINGNITPHGY